MKTSPKLDKVWNQKRFGKNYQGESGWEKLLRWYVFAIKFKYRRILWNLIPRVPMFFSKVFWNEWDVAFEQTLIKLFIVITFCFWKIAVDNIQGWIWIEWIISTQKRKNSFFFSPNQSFERQNIHKLQSFISKLASLLT